MHSLHHGPERNRPGGDGIREHLRRGRRACKEGKKGVREMPSGVRVDGKSLDQDVRDV